MRQVVDAHVPFDGLLLDRGAALARLVQVHLVEALATRTDLTVGPSRPVVDPGRPLRIRGDLDEVIAQGLGLDLDVVRKRAGSVGLEAALQAAAVPVGRQDDDRVDELTVRRLAGALDGRLAQGLLTALGKDRSRRDGRPGALADARTVDDVLDELIAAAPADEDE